MRLLLLATDYDWSQIIAVLLIVLPVRAITVRPVLGFPTATESCFLSNVLDVYHVNHFAFIHANFLVDLLDLTSTARALGDWAESKIRDVNDSCS